MAKILNGITGNPSGKMGNLIASSWKGIPYLKSRPIKVNQPNTEKQLAQRMRMNRVLEFVKPLKEFLPIGFGAYAINKSAYNVAMSENMRNALVGDYPEIHIDHARFLLSKGNLPTAEKPVVSLFETGMLKVTWRDNSSVYTADSDDKVIIVICNLKSYETVFNLESAKRSDKEVYIFIPENYKMEDIVCYVSFARQEYLDGKITERGISNSVMCELGG